jgi:putative ABC transport system ATP-binding protein
MLTDTAEKVESVTATVAPVVLQDVTKRYGRRRGAVAALDRVSLSFAAGSFTAVLGVSGSGKSTLLQCAAGLERPSAGRVRLCGTDLAGLSQRRQAVLRRRQVGFVFQDLNLRLLRGAADGTTVVIVTHDPQVTRFCDRAVFLQAGRVDQVLDDPEPAVVARVLHDLGERGL